MIHTKLDSEKGKSFVVSLIVHDGDQKGILVGTMMSPLSGFHDIWMEWVSLYHDGDHKGRLL